MTHLYLIRHGQAVSNVEPIIGGMKGDTGLTQFGILQAQRLRDRLLASEEIKADVFIASNLARARQTAEIIAPAFGLPIIWDEAVQELQIGEADGMLQAEAEAKFGKPDLRNDPFRPVFPGGETWGQFMMRVGAALDRITRQYQGKTIVVVCHGGVIDGSFITFFGMNSLMLPDIEFRTRNTSITHWERHTRQDGNLHWRLHKYNDAIHLRDLSEEAITWEEVSPQPVTGRDEPAVPLPTEDQ